jgi:hypothetical protein
MIFYLNDKKHKLILKKNSSKNSRTGLWCSWKSNERDRFINTTVWMNEIGEPVVVEFCFFFFFVFLVQWWGFLKTVTTSFIIIIILYNILILKLCKFLSISSWKKMEKKILFILCWAIAFIYGFIMVVVWEEKKINSNFYTVFEKSFQWSYPCQSFCIPLRLLLSKCFVGYAHILLDVDSSNVRKRQISRPLSFDRVRRTKIFNLKFIGQRFFQKA